MISKSHFRCPDLTDQVEVAEYPFASGGYADVFKGKWRIPNRGQRNVAIKVLRCPEPMEREKVQRHLRRETAIWSALDHPNVHLFFGLIDHGPFPGLVSPYCHLGNVSQYLALHNDADRFRILGDIARGLHYLHGHHVVHGDLKPQNVLITDDHVAQVCDFGRSRIIDHRGFTTAALMGTIRYMSPELITVEESDFDNESSLLVTTKCDVYAFGMTILEILTSKPPFYWIRSEAGVCRLIVEGQMPKASRYPSINTETWDVLQACWAMDPNLRPRMGDLAKFFSPLQDHSPEDHGSRSSSPELSSNASPHMFSQVKVALANPTSTTNRELTIRETPTLPIQGACDSTLSVKILDNALNRTVDTGSPRFSDTLRQRSHDDLALIASRGSKSVVNITKYVDVSVAQLAFDRATEKLLPIGRALAPACKSIDGEYLVQVGFDEDLIRRGEGALQKVYIHTNFEIACDPTPVLQHLGSIVSPFPVVLLTPSKAHELPLCSLDGSTMGEREVLLSLENRKAFVPISAMHHVSLPDPVALGSEPSNPNTADKNRLTKNINASDAQGAPDSNNDTGGNSASGGPGQSPSGRGGEEGGGARLPNNGQTLGGDGHPGDDARGSGGDGGGGGGGDEPSPGPGEGSTAIPPNAGSLSISLTASFDVTGNEESPPRLLQRFTTNSNIIVTLGRGRDARLYEQEFVPAPSWRYPGPWVEVEVNPLAVEAEESRIEYGYHLRSIQARVIRPSDCNVVNCLPETTPDAAAKYTKKKDRDNTFSFSASKLPTATFSHRRGVVTEEVKNRSKVTVFRNEDFPPDRKAVRWTYDIEDERQKKVGGSMDPPRVKFGLGRSDGPHLVIGVFSCWELDSLSMFAFWRRIRRNRPPLAHRNIIQKVSVSIPLDGVQGECHVPDSNVSTDQVLSTTTEHGPECLHDIQKAVHDYNGSRLNVQVALGRALYGIMKCPSTASSNPNIQAPIENVATEVSSLSTALEPSGTGFPLPSITLTSDSVSADMELLRSQVSMLNEENQELHERIRILEERNAGNPHRQPDFWRQMTVGADFVLYIVRLLLYVWFGPFF